MQIRLLFNISEILKAFYKWAFQQLIWEANVGLVFLIVKEDKGFKFNCTAHACMLSTTEYLLYTGILGEFGSVWI